MKRIYYIVFSLVLAGFLQSCTKDFEEINTNKNKFYNVDANIIFPGTVKRTMDLIGELNIQGRLLTFSRYSVLTFHAAPAQEIGDSFFNKFYVGIIRDLDNLERDYTGKEDSRNRLAIVKTWKMYMYYMMASIYGGVPMSEAITDGTDQKRSYKYDTEKEMYTQMLNTLAEAGALYNVSAPATGDYLATDPVFGAGGKGPSDLAKWEKFTNTLRLNIALHAQNISMDLAREHATAVMQDESKLISSVSDNVKLQWGTDADLSASYYFTRFTKTATSFDGGYPALNEYFALYLFSYNDPRIEKFAHKSNATIRNGKPLTPAGTLPFAFRDTLTRHHAAFCGNNSADPEHYCKDYAVHQADGYNNVRLDSFLVTYSMPYVPAPQESNGLAAGWEWEFIPGKEANGIRYSDPLNRTNPYQTSYIHDDFLKENASMILLSLADACFLKAEAAELFGLSGAQQYYEQGIRASFEQYGLSANVDAYMAQNGVKWNTNGRGYADRRLLYRANINGQGGPQNHLEQIYKQRYIADFFNCLEGWNLERRTRVLRFPPFFNNGQSSNADGFNSIYNYWNERMIYPIAEENKNKEAYYQGIENLKAESPYFRADRWGDNIYTSLGFAKLNPDLAIANYLYAGNKRLVSRAEYFSKKYGNNYDEVVATAKQMTGKTDTNIALKEAFNYNFLELLVTYIP